MSDFRTGSLMDSNDVEEDLGAQRFIDDVEVAAPASLMMGRVILKGLRLSLMRTVALRSILIRAKTLMKAIFTVT